MPLPDHQRLTFNLYMHLSASAPPNNCPITPHYSPSATALASSRLDIAIANTILRITNSLPYLPPCQSLIASS